VRALVTLPKERIKGPSVPITFRASDLFAGEEIFVQDVFISTN